MIDRIHSQLTSSCVFEPFALELFAWQFGKNRHYARYCEQLNKTPDRVENWREIPALPTDLFKIDRISCHPMTEHERVFCTSGTTQDVAGRHYFPNLDLYETSILGGWEHLGLPRVTRPIFLVPHPDEVAHSSLSHMMGVIAETATTPSWAVDSSGAMDVEAVIEASRGNDPVAVLGTALAFLHLFSQLEAPLCFPKGSWAMETGGYKGTQRQIGKSELYQMFRDRLGIRKVFNEYSMTELSSQFYAEGVEGRHSGPPWVRARVIDPLTGCDAAQGEAGHLAIYDLANAHSVMAIQTQDLAVAHEDGSFSLIGRDPTAIARGCSRSSDDQLSAPSQKR